jgi:hypothetical protein
MKKVIIPIKILLIAIGVMLVVKCNQEISKDEDKYKTKYSIYLPDRPVTSCWYDVNEYKDLNNGHIQFISKGGRIIRSNNFEIVVNY